MEGQWEFFIVGAVYFLLPRRESQVMSGCFTMSDVTIAHWLQLLSALLWTCPSLFYLIVLASIDDRSFAGARLGFAERALSECHFSLVCVFTLSYQNHKKWWKKRAQILCSSTSRREKSIAGLNLLPSANGKTLGFFFLLLFSSDDMNYVEERKTWVQRWELTAVLT